VVLRCGTHPQEPGHRTGSGKDEGGAERENSMKEPDAHEENRGPVSAENTIPQEKLPGLQLLLLAMAPLPTSSQPCPKWR
jgi:hypothetical protein